MIDNDTEQAALRPAGSGAANDSDPDRQLGRQLSLPFTSQAIAPPTAPRSSAASVADRRASSMSAAERTLWARAAAYAMHSTHDSRTVTANARAAFADRFLRQVDPTGVLPEAERARRAECARRAYFTALAAKSARARRQRRDG